MALERRSPLPPGRYWIDVIGTENIRDFFALLSTAVTLGVVVIENTQIDGDVVDLAHVLDVLAGGGGAQAWVLFRVTGVGTFAIDSTRFGFPTIATDEVKQKDDTVQKPDPNGGLWQAAGFVLLGAILVKLLGRK